MAKRMLVKPQWRRLPFDMPTGEDSVILTYTLSLFGRLQIEVRRHTHNRLGFASGGGIGFNEGIGQCGL